MGIMDQINNMVQTANETAMKINELQNQGFRKVSAKKFDYHTDFADYEEQALKQYKSSAILSFIPMVIFVAIFGGVFAYAFGVSINSDDGDPVAMGLALGIVGLICALMIIMPIIQIVGKKSACQATVVGKRMTTTHSNKGRTRHHFYAIAYQSTPERLFATDISINRKLYDELFEGDSITIIKSPVDCRAFKPY